MACINYFPLTMSCQIILFLVETPLTSIYMRVKSINSYVKLMIGASSGSRLVRPAVWDMYLLSIVKAIVKCTYTAHWSAWFYFLLNSTIAKEIPAK